MRTDEEIAGRTGGIDQINTKLTDQVVSNHDEDDDGQSPRHYMLARDRVRREIRSPSKYAYVDIIAYALNIGGTIELEEPVTFTEATEARIKQIGSKQCKKRWIHF